MEPGAKQDSPAYTAPQRFDELVQEHDEPDRSDWQNPAAVIDLMQPLSGKTVADIGAGTGYFSFLLASEGARVLAIDIDEAALDYIREHLQSMEQGRKKISIECRLTIPDDPGLEAAEADAVLMVNTYPYLQDRISYLARIREGMKRGAQLVIVDFKDIDSPVSPSHSYRLPPQKVVADLNKAGFDSVNKDLNSLEFQYIITSIKR